MNANCTIVIGCRVSGNVRTQDSKAIVPVTVNEYLKENGTMNTFDTELVYTNKMVEKTKSMKINSTYIVEGSVQVDEDKIPRIYPAYTTPTALNDKFRYPNTITVNGRTTKDIKTLKNGKGITSIAVYRDKNSTDFFNLFFNEKSMPFATKYYTKGTGICIVGTFSVNSYTASNGTTYVNGQISVSNAGFAGQKSDIPEERTNTQNNYNSEVSDAPFEAINVADDEIPF